MRIIGGCAGIALLCLIAFRLVPDATARHRHFGYPCASPDGRSCVVWEMDYERGLGIYRLWLARGSDVFLLADSRAVPLDKVLARPQAVLSQPVWHGTECKVAWFEHKGNSDYLVVYDVDAGAADRRRIASPALGDYESAAWCEPLFWLPAKGRGIVAVYRRWRVTSSEKVVMQELLCEVDPFSGRLCRSVPLGNKPLSKRPRQVAYVRGDLLYIIDGRLRSTGSGTAMLRGLRDLGDLCEVTSDGEAEVLVVQRVGRKRQRVLLVDSRDGSARQVMEANGVLSPQSAGGNRVLAWVSRGEGKGFDLVCVDRNGQRSTIFPHAREPHYTLIRKANSTVVWLCPDKASRAIIRLVLGDSSLLTREDMAVEGP